MDTNIVALINNVIVERHLGTHDIAQRFNTTLGVYTAAKKMASTHTVLELTGLEVRAAQRGHDTDVERLTALVLDAYERLLERIQYDLPQECYATQNGDTPCTRRFIGHPVYFNVTQAGVYDPFCDTYTYTFDVDVMLPGAADA